MAESKSAALPLGDTPKKLCINYTLCHNLMSILNLHKIKIDHKEEVFDLYLINILALFL
jgi:hypothetical protein